MDMVLIVTLANIHSHIHEQRMHENLGQNSIDYYFSEDTLEEIVCILHLTI